MKQLLYISFIIFHQSLSAQVAVIAGSYADATANGSGASGLPTLNYTTQAGTDRLLIFTMSFERDHMPTTGSNWANPATTGGASPVVQLGGVSLTRLRTLRYFHYASVNNVTDATISVELIVYGLLEAGIPAGTNTFTVTGVNNPANAGDEAVYTATMFENVAAVNYLAASGCESCNAINLASVTPNDVNNMVLGFTAAGSDRTISNGAGYTLIGRNAITNSSGTYTPYSERDGLATAAQYITGTTAAQALPFSFSGAADVSGSVEVGFRLVSNILLPVELSYFKGEANGLNNELYWETKSEIDNDYFDVERSSDGFYWDKIGRVNGSGSTFEARSYEYLDENVTCTNCYYRLKQVDTDGDVDYSNIVVIKSNFQNSFTVLPNPTSETLKINSKEDIISVTIFNKYGQSMVNTLDVFSSQYQTQVVDFPSGVYQVRIQTESGFITQQFVKR